MRLGLEQDLHLVDEAGEVRFAFENPCGGDVLVLQHRASSTSTRDEVCRSTVTVGVARRRLLG